MFACKTHAVQEDKWKRTNTVLSVRNRDFSFPEARVYSSRCASSLRVYSSLCASSLRVYSSLCAR